MFCKSLVVGSLMLASLSPGVLLAIEMPAADPAQISTSPSDEDTFFKRHIEGKLQLGTRSVYRHLTDSDSGAKPGSGQGDGTFLGTIYALDEEQNYSPIHPFLTYNPNRYFGVELAYDSMEAETVAMSAFFMTVKTDGNVSLSGPTLSLLGRYPNTTAFTPYAGIGLGFFTGDFDEEPSWALGYPDPSIYESLGSPNTIYNGRTRQMDVDDTVAVLLTVGTAWQFHTNWAADFSIQYVSADADATFYGYTDDVLDTNQSGTFPLDNLAIRIGLVYQF